MRGVIIPDGYRVCRKSSDEQTIIIEQNPDIKVRVSFSEAVQLLSDQGVIVSVLRWKSN